MSQSGPPVPPPPPGGWSAPPGYPPYPVPVQYPPHAQYAPPPMRPQVVQVVSRPGGFAHAVGLILGLFAFAAVFGVGLALGLAIMFAGSGFDQMILPSVYRDGARETVAVIPIHGTINGQQAAFVRGAVNEVLSSSKYDAVILRVNSPGGGVTPSDQIWYEVERLKKANIPVVASFGGVAASGGYYVSCGADHILAEETCITGSIGVIAQVFTMEGLMDKVGIEPVTLVASGSPRKHIANDVFRAWTDEDREKVLVMLDGAYDMFTERVRAGRLAAIGDEDRVDELADGSIYTAKQAMESGLIDSVGYLDDAIVKAEQLAGLPKGRATVVMLTQPPTLFGTSPMMGRMGAQELPQLDADSVREFVSDLSTPQVMYRMH